MDVSVEIRHSIPSDYEPWLERNLIRNLPPKLKVLGMPTMPSGQGFHGCCSKIRTLQVNCSVAIESLGHVRSLSDHNTAMVRKNTAVNNTS